MARRSSSKLQHVHDRVRPLREMEGLLVRAARRGLSPRDYGFVRYGLNLAQIDVVPTASGPADLHGAFGRLRTQLIQRLSPVLSPHHVDVPALAGLVRDIEPLVESARARVLAHHANQISEAELERETRHKALVVVAGGGGGAGYVHAGAFKLVDDLGLVPSLIVGTSMGSVIGLFRAHKREFHLPTLMGIAQGMRWNRVFGVPNVRNRYGLPATLRLFLRRAIGEHFAHPTEDRGLRLDELEIPLRVIVAGLSRSALTHDVAYYEHLMDGVGRKRALRRQLGALFSLIKELGRKRARELVLGGDDLTRDFDAVDAVGFSSAVPGLIHYDLWREDGHMEARLNALFAHHGLDRLVDGGLVNNVPARAAWEEVRRGAIGTRNAFILALDAFAPQRGRNLMTLPVQQLVRPQVRANAKFADLSVGYRRVLSPLELVPSGRKVAIALRNGYQEVARERAFIREMMRPLPPWRDLSPGRSAAKDR